MESVLCSLIIGVSLWYETTGRKDTSLVKLLLANASRTYYDTASFFTLAIQVACIITLAKVDWDLGADGMGGITKDITWLVSSLSLLPLVVLILRPCLFKEPESVDSPGRPSREQRTIITTLETSRPSHTESGEAVVLAKARQEQRLLFLIMCWALAFCPFYSRMGGTFGKLLKIVD